MGRHTEYVEPGYELCLARNLPRCDQDSLECPRRLAGFSNGEWEMPKGWTTLPNAARQMGISVGVLQRRIKAGRVTGRWGYIGQCRKGWLVLLSQEREASK